MINNTPSLSWTVASRTAQGRRENQEDRMVITTITHHGLFAAVIDGHKDESTAETLCTLITREYDLLGCLSGKDVLAKKVLFSVLHAKLIEGTRHLESGAVLSACFLDPFTKDVTILHLGDTACILYRKGRTILKTTPHNVRCNKADRQALVDAGCNYDFQMGYIMTPEFSFGLQPTRTYGNVHFQELLRMPEILQHPIERGDSLLLLTDGTITTDNLNGYRSDANFFGEILSSKEDTSIKVERILYEGMLRKHSRDNATAILISIS